MTFQFKALGSRTFQLGFHRVNLHLLTSSNRLGMNACCHTSSTMPPASPSPPSFFPLPPMPCPTPMCPLAPTSLVPSLQRRKLKVKAKFDRGYITL